MAWASNFCKRCGKRIGGATGTDSRFFNGCSCANPPVIPSSTVPVVRKGKDDGKEKVHPSGSSGLGG